MTTQTALSQTTLYGISVTIPVDYADAVERMRRALADEGFGVLTEIDVRATMQKKLGVEFRPYIILGACNPPFAYQALSADLEIGLLLPCNVIVYAGDAPNTSVVSAIDPIAALELTGNDAVKPIAHEVRVRLERVLAAVERTDASREPAVQSRRQKETP